MQFFLFLISCTLLLSYFVPPAYADTSLFGRGGARSSNLSPFPKWNGMLDRFENSKALASRSCKEKGLNECTVKEWESLLVSLKNQDARTQIETINREMNRAKYILDIVNWGISDYWATPFQFLLKNGDCEDYAIVKYMSLKRLGFGEEDMRVVVLEDTNLNAIHSVLAVNLGSETLILDNQIKSVLKDSMIHHYKPVYSINESAWWRYR